MKKAVIFSMTVLFTVSVLNGKTLKTDKEPAKDSLMEVKTERVALRKLEGSRISAFAKANFTSEFGNISDVDWNRGNIFDEASFSKDGKMLTAYYDYDGNLVGTTEVKTFKDLPAKGQQEIKNRYKDYSIGNVIFFHDSGANKSDMLLYAREFEDADNYFVELQKGTKKIVLKVDTHGYVEFFTTI